MKKFRLRVWRGMGGGIRGTCEKLFSMKSVCFDVETSGLSPAHGGRVIEVGAVAIVDGTIGAEFSTLIHIDCDIHWAAERVHGISRSMLRGQPPPTDVWPAFLDFVGGAPLIAHNARFDAGFLHFELEHLGMTLRNPIHCSLPKSAAARGTIGRPGNMATA